MEIGRIGGTEAVVLERLDKLRPELMKYCLKITNCRWDAEDLAQETTIRIIRSLGAKPDRPLSKAFLYRIASNLWIDQLRKKRVASEPLDTRHEQRAAPESAFQTRELLELLADRLSPKYMVVLLMMDVFDFTAKETARMMSVSEGAVQITLSRARTKLKALSGERGEENRSGGGRKMCFPAHSHDFESLVEAFRNRDPQAIYSAYLGLSGQGLRIQGIKSMSGRLVFTFRDTEGNTLLVTS
ncbi:RNA polymerase sigma factor [Paenibacillus flagellatus]|uniref:RNA polymerase sigma factor n=1 Tax=Paenibacillus flagellatus TaxID=2211139 RepID=A0A2V5KB26_9BACL|nr:RNA polymerase sigma factor [Paenibacillus flagellatus]PYI55113.1 RNA polymerase sigma factor [Paenibacillus flagellatus]